MKVSLFIPCFVDQFMPEVGVAVVEVLERLGVDVAYPPNQTCCGQPAFNAGFDTEAREVARHQLEQFPRGDLVVTPSGSCAAMLRVFYPRLFGGTAEADVANDLGSRTCEFSEFVERECDPGQLGARFPHRVTFHDGCHGLRELGIRDAPRRLLSHVEDIEFVESDESETCCGFGGLFSIKFPQVSTSMVESKCASIARTGATHVISNDPSCLLQIRGYLEKHLSPIRCMHIAEVLNAR